MDRLQAALSARLPLSGDRLPAASQVLATCARTLHGLVLAIVDSDDPPLLGLLDADITLTLSPTEDPAAVQVTVAERDFGTIGSAYPKPGLIHARFLDAGAARVTAWQNCDESRRDGGQAADQANEVGQAGADVRQTTRANGRLHEPPITLWVMPERRRRA
ncbi:hypothetical protein ACYF6T_41795 [Streptomyces sp. 7R007]